jgi:putative ABC transport system ATP-binding protein
MIKLENIKKHYTLWNQRLDILNWIDLEIKDGEFVSIMWPSWSGKSTLMNIIWMLDESSSWKYSFNKDRIDWLTEDEVAVVRSKNIWFIFQSYNLIPKMPVIKQVMLPLFYQGTWKEERMQRALEALKKVGLEDRINNKPNELSWGQQQRVSIARALAVNPWMILADEPTWALDSKTWIEIMELLKKLNEKEWKTVILITHDKNVSEYAKRHINIKDWLIIN